MLIESLKKEKDIKLFQNKKTLDNLIIELIEKGKQVKISNVDFIERLIDEFIESINKLIGKL